MNTPEPLTEKQANLARKSIWVTVLLSFLFPPGGYIYTYRWTIGSIVSFLYIGGLLASNESDVGFSLLSLTMVCSPLENSIQVIRAKWKNRKYQTSSSQEKSPKNVAAEQTQILRLIQMRREVTLADVVIEINISVDQARSLLVELERNDCIRSRNRDIDGAIIYSVV